MLVTGELKEYPLTDLLEIFQRKQETGILEITSPQSSGHFYLRAGRIVDAGFGDLAEAEAIKFAQALPAAAFTFKPMEPVEYALIVWERTLRERTPRGGEGPPRPGFASAVAELSRDVSAAAKSLAPAARSIHRAVSSRLPRVSGRRRSGMLPPAPDGTNPPPAPFRPARWSGLRLPSLTPLKARALSLKRVAANKSRAFTYAALLFIPLAVIARLDIPLVKSLPWRHLALPLPAGVIDGTASDAPDTPELKTGFTVLSDEARVSGGRGRAARSPAAERASAAGKRGQADAPRGKRVAEEGPPRSRADRRDAPPASKTAAGVQAVRVSLQIEDGRVTGASVLNHRPGMEAYESTALLIARQRLYPPTRRGKEVLEIKVQAPK